MESGRCYSLVSKCLCCKCSSDAYHDMSLRSNFVIYILDLLIFVHSASIGVLTNVNSIHRKASISMIDMHVDAI